MKTVAVVAAFVALAAALFALEVAVIMLASAGLHSHVSESIPKLGVTGAVWVSVALNLVGSFFRRSAA